MRDCIWRLRAVDIICAKETNSVGVITFQQSRIESIITSSSYVNVIGKQDEDDHGP